MEVLTQEVNLVATGPLNPIEATRGEDPPPTFQASKLISGGDTPN